MTLLLEYPLRTDWPKYDDEEVVVGAVECVECGAEVELRGTPCAWEEQDDGSLKVIEVGPGLGWCCGFIYLDDVDGVTVYRDPPEMKCRVCGCTEGHACPGGCVWVGPDLCSRCG